MASPNEPPKVADLIDFEAGIWKEDLLLSLFDEPLATAIKETPFRLPTTEDKLVWPNNKSGTYTVKSGYFSNRKPDIPSRSIPTSSHHFDPLIWKLIWNSVVQPKIKFFLWSACQNALPTLDNLYRRKMVPEPLCPICKSEPETIEHTLLLCPWMTQVWNDSSLQTCTY